VRESSRMANCSGTALGHIFQVGTTAGGKAILVIQYRPHGFLEQFMTTTGRVGRLAAIAWTCRGAWKPRNDASPASRRQPEQLLTYTATA